MVWTPSIKKRKHQKMNLKMKKNQKKMKMNQTIQNPSPQVERVEEMKTMTTMKNSNPKSMLEKTKEMMKTLMTKIQKNLGL